MVPQVKIRNVSDLLLCPGSVGSSSCLVIFLQLLGKVEGLAEGSLDEALERDP